MPVPIVYQDNTAVIQMTTQNAKPQINKQMTVRQNDIVEKSKEGSIRIECIKTDQMLADGLTKPLQGTIFRSFRKRIFRTQEL